VQQGNIEIFMPLVAGDELVGVLGLGEKYTGEAYSHADLAWLQDICTHGGLLLWQAKELQQARARLEQSRSEMQAVWREVNRLQELLALHERFTSMVSPALRQPFAEIHHKLDDLVNHYESNGATQTIGDLNRQIAQLRLTVNNLIVSAARVRRQHSFTLDSVDMVEVIDEAVRDLEAMASARHVTVAVHCDMHVPLVEGDRQHLYEAVQHLLHNAIRFNKIGGRVDVECGASDRSLYLHVRDSGIGIPADQMEEIWVGGAEAGGDDGNRARSGLGLALTRFVVRAHGGYVEASSSADQGSVFSLYLPLAGAESYEAVFV
jgi:signal transduction histidine kinase